MVSEIRFERRSSAALGRRSPVTEYSRVPLRNGSWKAAAKVARLGAMNTTRTPAAPPLRQAIAELGFRPAILDVTTMTIYRSFDGLAGLPGPTLVAGFERGGFFYTRGAAERAAREWA